MENLLEMVSEHNERVTQYSTDFKTRNDLEHLAFKEWMAYNTGLQPLVKEAFDIVELLHQSGFNDFKVNAQSGIII